jgi:hypothetical protein
MGHATHTLLCRVQQAKQSAQQYVMLLQEVLNTANELGHKAQNALPDASLGHS